jgi:hypothetical protein
MDLRSIAIVAQVPTMASKRVCAGAAMPNIRITTVVKAMCDGSNRAASFANGLIKRVELRGLEPLFNPAETGSELRRMLDAVVTRCIGHQQICVGVSRDVTVLGRRAATSKL